MNSRKLLLSIIMGIALMLPGSPSPAADKVIVVPLGGGNKSLKGDLYKTIPYAQFTPGNNTTDYVHGWFVASLGYLTLDSGSTAIFNAPVNLPDGAVVSEFSLSATDHSDSRDITVWFQKIELDSTHISFIPDTNGISSSSLSTDETSLISRVIDDEVIDNEKYYYCIYALFNGSPSDRLKAVRIKYTLP